MSTPTTETPPDNPELHLAAAYVRDTGCNIFLTGKAGTGKTTFLRNLKKSGEKRMVVTAPTGVAAINAGGVTLHSFFQLPFGPFIPGNDTPKAQHRFSREKIRTIKSLDLLVIDEISMVRADVLDSVDSVLRRLRYTDAPFGGVQLLMIGDLFQLPPVVRRQDWELLCSYYDSPYFFSSNALSKTETVTIELKHIYRQSDDRFIDLLNRVRDDRMDPVALAALNCRHIPGFIPAEKEGYITLCTHNRMADAINDARLSALKQPLHRFEAEIEGEYPEPLFPTAATLGLKTGAQVMFIRNDLSPEKRYFNGKIGAITRISDQGIRIQCPGEPDPIDVTPVEWENIDYALDPQSMVLSEKKIGVFRQYPLSLAWAVTIHKSQGLTFDKAVIDAQAAFAHGQVYVALSRCRTLEGIVLSTPLSPAAMKTDALVRRYSAAAEDDAPSVDRLEVAKIRYQQRLILECFDFTRLRVLMQRWIFLVLGNLKRIHVSGVTDLREVRERTEKEICTVSDNFLRQLRGLFSETVLPGADPVVLERISKASVYFQEKIANGIGHWVHRISMDTDNADLAKKIENALNALRKETEIKQAAVGCCANGFSPSRYFRAVSGAEIHQTEKKEKSKNSTARESAELSTDIAHPELYQALRMWRDQKADLEDIAKYQVLHQRSLMEIANRLPDTLPALKEIWGIGKRLAARYGEELLAMVIAYRKEHHITEVMLPDPPPAENPSGHRKPTETDTKRITLDLFQKGMTLAQIAKARGLVVSTIEGHMAHYVETGRVPIDALMPAEKQGKIAGALLVMAGKSFGEIKQALGEEISYGEIKLVQAHQRSRPMA